MARSKRAVERLLESGSRYLEGKPGLKMNREKSRVTSASVCKKFRFLGFCPGKNGTGIFLRAHKSVLRKARAKLKRLTKRNRGHNVRNVVQDVKVFIRGWLEYYYVADMKRTLQDWNAWLRRRFRMEADARIV